MIHHFAAASLATVRTRPSPSPDGTDLNGVRIPDGPVVRFLVRVLVHPGQAAQDVLRGVHHALAVAAPAVIRVGLVVVLVIAAVKIITRFRDARLARDGRRVLILPPPEVSAHDGEVLWTALHGLIRPRWRRLVAGQPAICWEVHAQPQQTEISLCVPAGVPLDLVEHAVRSAWPGASVMEAPADLGFPPEDARVRFARMMLARPDAFPLGSGPDNDPLRLALASMAGVGEGQAAVLQVLATPVPAGAGRKLLRRYASSAGGRAPGVLGWLLTRNARRGAPPRDPTRDAEERAVHQKASAPLFASEIRIGVAARTRGQATARAHSLASSFAMFEGTSNGLRSRRMIRGPSMIGTRRRTRSSYLLSVPELARVATLPSVAVPGLDAAGSRVVAPPRSLPSSEIVLGSANSTLADRPVAITHADARHHLHVVGETGSGKSTLLANLILQDAAAGRSAVVVDPKGDLVEAVLQRLPEAAAERTCVLDPADSDYAVGLNVLEGGDPDLVADQLIALFKRIYEHHWGPRTDDLLRGACLTLARIPGATLAEIPILFTDEAWRKAIRARLHDPALRHFWEQFDAKTEAKRQEDIAPLMNKLRAFLLRGTIRRIVGQATSRLELDSFLASGGLLLVRLPKGLIGEDTSRLLGGVIVARVWQAAMRRAALPESARADVTLYVDEVQHYLTLPRSFEDLLAEARGYGLSLVRAHQHLRQLPPEMREALAANARTKICFTVSPGDARILEDHFAPQLGAYDLARLPAHTAACRPCVGGAPAAAFTFRTTPLAEGSPARAQDVRAVSRERFAATRFVVEGEIRTRQRRPERSLLPAPEPRDQPGARPVDQSGDQPLDRPSPIEEQGEGSAGEAA